eukprot:SAG31_NODE_5483_length_2513_cov_2.273405_3_plen_62_part_00
MMFLIHLQVTGTELPSDTTPEQARERITIALRGQCALVILDDIWEVDVLKCCSVVFKYPTN